MKELEVLPGDDVQIMFTKAWQLYHALHGKEPVTFHINDFRVIILPDESHSETSILTDKEARKLIENQSRRIE